MSFRFPMTRGSGLTKVWVMAERLNKEYLESVLGWKDLTPLLRVRRSSTQSLKSPFAIYAPNLSDPDALLLGKMMSAIGVSDYQVIDQINAFSSFIHVLVFSEKEGIEERSCASRLWMFWPLEAYRTGSSGEISQRKREAWDLLQAFKSEVIDQ